MGRRNLDTLVRQLTWLDLLGPKWMFRYTAARDMAEAGRIGIFLLFFVPVQALLISMEGALRFLGRHPLQAVEAAQRAINKEADDQLRRADLHLNLHRQRDLGLISMMELVQRSRDIERTGKDPGPLERETAEIEGGDRFA